jgi:hypothetical protein
MALSDGEKSAASSHQDKVMVWTALVAPSGKMLNLTFALLDENY